MARNPFEQLQDLLPEPRQAFEDMVTLMLKCTIPLSRRVGVYRGDGGVDSFTGRMGEGGSVEVYQVKYFVDQWGEAQKRQIRESYKTARESKDYNLERWTLCIPVRPTKEDIRWFDEWRRDQNHPIELMDGDDLTRMLDRDECASARSKLRDWGVHGLQPEGPRFGVTAYIRPEDYDRTGRTAIATLWLKNEGDRSGRSIKAVVKHTETNCAVSAGCDGWDTCGHVLNPRTLRYRHTLNCGENAAIITIPLCPRSEKPLRVKVTLTAEDCRPSVLRCTITEEHTANPSKVVFEPAND